MTLFDYSSYKSFVNDWISRQPKKGHGQLRQLSLKLKINSVVMSQVFRGSRDLTLEQGLGVCQFLGLSELERDYFLLLVQKNKAGTHELKQVLESQLEKLREIAKALKNRITHQKFSDESKATFYSQWYYSAIRLAASLEKLNSADSIAQHLNLERALVAKVLEFLLRNKLVVETKKGLDRGPQVTHVGHDSPYVNRHHLNWRLKALQSMETVSDSHLFYTGPMALSHEAASEIHKMLIDFVQRSTSRAAASESQVLRCLNFDWFPIKP